MKPTLKIFAVLLTLIFSFLHAQDQDFTSCAKTYVAPDKVSLTNNKIHINGENQSGQTSAIYSDYTGFYYTDFLDDLYEEDIVFEGFDESEVFSIYSDKPSILFESPIITSPLEAIQIEQDKPMLAWPYSDKRR